MSYFARGLRGIPDSSQYVHRLGANYRLPPHQVDYPDLLSARTARREPAVIQSWTADEFNIAEWGNTGSGIPCLEITHRETDGIVSASHRSEVASFNDYFGPAIDGRTLWVGKSIIPSDTPFALIASGGDDIIMGQIHQNGSSMTHPPIIVNILDYVSGRMRLRLHNWQSQAVLITRVLFDYGATPINLPIERIDTKLRVKFSQGADGFIDIWFRKSANLGDYTGAWTSIAGITGPTIGPDTTQLYLKDGIYRGGTTVGDMRIRSRGYWVADEESKLDALFRGA